MSLFRVVQFAILNLRRTLPQQWLFWASCTAGVALVGIGSGVAGAIDADSAIEQMDSTMATEFLAWCAIAVAGIHGVIMSTRLLQADQSLFRLFFALGFTPAEIMIIRGSELFIGSSSTILVGMIASMFTLYTVFRVPLSSVSSSCTIWCVLVGYLPMFVLPSLLRSRRLTNHR